MVYPRVFPPHSITIHSQVSFVFASPINVAQLDAYLPEATEVVVTLQYLQRRCWQLGQQASMLMLLGPKLQLFYVNNK